jgi:hyperosmotically inducible protein
MRFDRKLVVLGVTLAGLTSVLITGCNKPQETTGTPSANTTAGTEIDDTVVTTRVKSALLADPDIKSFDLKVETRKGTVQLSGFVDNQTQIDRAVAATRVVEGVKDIENNISLKSGHATIGNTVDDDVITTKVKSALLADPSVKSFDIAVVTRKGEIQLSGFVDSQAQIDQAIAIAQKVSGMTNVRNEMNIKK